jgi:hypothetical protein
MSASDVANIAAPPTPCRPRARLSRVGVPAAAHRMEARVKRTRPAVKISRRPRRSDSVPAVRSSAASDRA